MPLNFNSTQSKDIVNSSIDILKLNPITDDLPKHVVPTIQPIVELNKPIAIIRSANSSSTGAVSVFNTPSDRDFFLTSAGFGLAKDSTCDADAGEFELTGVIGGTARALVALANRALVAQTESAHVTFPVPVKIDRGTTITMAGTFVLGTCQRMASISGYLLEAGNNLSV